MAKTLGDRLGCVLFQCPPSLQYRRELIEAFVGYLPPPGAGVPRFAMEFRHPSWTEARELLLSQGVAWCVAETDDKDPGPDDLSWEPAGYLRLRKTEYTDDELDRVGRRASPGARRRQRRVLLLQARGRRREPEDGETPDDRPRDRLASGPTPLQVPVREQPVGALVEPLGRDDLEPEGVGHAVDQVEEEADIERVDHSRFAHAGLEEPLDVLGSEFVRPQGHVLEQVERRMDARVHRS